MGLFSQLGDKKVTNRNPKIPAGNHVLKFQSIKKGKARTGGLEYIASELEIVETDNPQFKPGMVVSNMIYLNDGWESQLKSFLGALMAYDDFDEVDEADAEAAFSSENPLSGELVKCQADAGKTKGGHDAIFKNWHVYSPSAKTAVK